MQIKQLLIGLFCGATLLTAQAAPTSWTWATEATYPPFESTTASGEIVGFDVDLMNSICSTLHQPCTLVNAPFASLIPSLTIGKYDAIIGGLAITDQRKKVIDFSTSYYQDGVIFVAKHKMKPTNQTVGVQGGTSYQAFLQKYYPNINVKTYSSNLNALMDLKSGRIDAVLIDEPVFVAWDQGNNAGTSFVTSIAAVTQAQKKFLILGGNGIGIAKGNNATLTKINQALATLQKNGTLAKLKKKWFHHA